MARYQALICSLTYSATGNIGRSEELAQETFLAAWQQLGSLREPDRLRSWLCGIARNITRNAFRDQAREPLHEAAPLETAPEAPSTEPLPSEQVISREEETIVWLALERTPDLYREPLILFYREGCSVAAVARQLGLSEDAVKQRLARGRAMLRAQTVAVVEGALRRSRPGLAFTLAVMAALPVVVAGSATGSRGGRSGQDDGARGQGAPLSGWHRCVAWSPYRIARWCNRRLGKLAANAVSARKATLAPQLHFLRRGHGLLLRALLRDEDRRAARCQRSSAGVGSVARGVDTRLSPPQPGLDVSPCAPVAADRAEELAARTAPLPEPPVVRRISRWRSKWEGRQWHSRWSFLGLPLVDVNFSSPNGESLDPKALVSALSAGKPNRARGWIALGDRAQGILFACGNVAIGGIAIGGVSAGVVAIGGAAVGLVSVGGGALGALAIGGMAVGAVACGGGAVGGWVFGGLALGWMAWGGLAIAWRAAMGGLACAHDLAVGGMAIAAHANDAVARESVANCWFFDLADWHKTHVLPWMHGPWFQLWVLGLSLLVPALLFAVGYRRRKAAALCLLAALSPFSRNAQAEEPKPEAFTLGNGIRLVSVHFAQRTTLAIFTFVPLGLVDDGPRQAQWSHLVEHMVIRSTVPNDLSIANAETLPDHMRLDFYGNVGNWRDGMAHPRRWLQGVPFLQASLDAEKPRVKAELDYTVKNWFTHKFALVAWAQGFRHGQSHAALQGDMDRASLNEIQACRDNQLAVSNHILMCVVGGIEPAEVLRIASEQLRGIKLEGKEATAVKLHPGNREMTWDLDARHLLLTWPVPGPEAADFPALLTAAQWLNVQFSSDDELKKSTGMTLAGANLATPEGQFLYVSASLRPGISFANVQARLDRHLRALSTSDQALQLAPILAKQQAESLAHLPDPSSMKGQLPPNVTIAMVEMNLGL